MIKVSVCIPTYNNPELFKKCLHSVLDQDYKNYEIVVSDDSTNDNIKDYVESLNLNNLNYFKNARPLGSPANWNNALRKAKGKYIKIMHHDDYFTNKTSLGKFVKILDDNPTAKFCFSQSLVHFVSDNTFYVNKQNKGQIIRMSREIEFLFFRNIIGAPSAVCFVNERKILFEERFKWLVDVEFYIRFLKLSPYFVHIEEPLVTVLDGAVGQITPDVSADRKLVISENLELFSSVYSTKLNRKKSLLYFQELFSNYSVLSYENLTNDFQVPENINDFVKEVFTELPKARLLKKITKRLLTSRYNKQIFKIERF